MSDFLPKSDLEFDLWLDNFVDKLGDLQATLSLAPATVSAISTSHNDFKSKLGEVSVKQAELSAAVEAKNSSYAALRTAVRALARTLQANPQLTNENRAKLGLTVPDTTRTPTAVPSTHPIAQIDVNQPLRHTGEFRDEATPNRRAKPTGVYGCEVRYQIGGAEPVDPEQMLSLGVKTKSPFIQDFNITDAGKIVYYHLRWVNSRGQHGPWSELISATVTKKG